MVNKPENLSEIRLLLISEDAQKLLEVAARRKRLLSQLTALSYDLDPVVSQRAIWAFGLAAHLIAETDPEYVRNHFRRLIWLLSDESGGIGWRAPELLGEALYYCHTCFPEYLPILVSLLDLEPEDAPRFRPGVIWAIGRVAQVAPQAMKPAAKFIQVFLEYPDPQVAALAHWCLEQFETAPAGAK